MFFVNKLQAFLSSNASNLIVETIGGLIEVFLIAGLIEWFRKRREKTKREALKCIAATNTIRFYNTILDDYLWLLSINSIKDINMEMSNLDVLPSTQVGITENFLDKINILKKLADRNELSERVASIDKEKFERMLQGVDDVARDNDALLISLSHSENLFTRYNLKKEITFSPLKNTLKKIVRSCEVCESTHKDYLDKFVTLSSFLPMAFEAEYYENIKYLEFNDLLHKGEKRPPEDAMLYQIIMKPNPETVESRKKIVSEFDCKEVLRKYDFLRECYVNSGPRMIDGLYINSMYKDLVCLMLTGSDDYVMRSEKMASLYPYSPLWLNYFGKR